MARSTAPNVDWHLLSLEQLERHLEDLKAVGKTPTAAFMTALRRARQQAAEPRRIPPPQWEPPRGTFSVLGEAGLRELFPGMERETAQLLVDEADDGYAPGSPDTLGRFVAEVRDSMTGALQTGAVYKITRPDDGSYLVTDTARDERE